jgi:hypothetical protein
VPIREVVPGADELIQDLNVGDGGEAEVKFPAELLLKLIEESAGEDIWIGGHWLLTAAALICEDECGYPQGLELLHRHLPSFLEKQVEEGVCCGDRVALHSQLVTLLIDPRPEHLE